MNETAPRSKFSEIGAEIGAVRVVENALRVASH